MVVNLAAQAGVRYSITNPDAYVESNLVGFFNILEACRHCESLEHLVYASSSSVYGSNKKVPYSTDDKVDNPVSLYAATKKSNELMAHHPKQNGVVELQSLNFPKFVEFAKEKDTSCVMCHVENELKKQQKTAIITLDGNDLITSYEEKPKEPKGNLAVPPFYCYRACDVKRIQEALDNGCGYDAPGSFAAWLSKQTPMHACTSRTAR